MKGFNEKEKIADDDRGFDRRPTKGATPDGASTVTRHKPEHDQSMRLPAPTAAIEKRLLSASPGRRAGWPTPISDR